MRAFINFLRRDLWTPYGAGVLLGLVAVASMWAADHTVGASGAFQSVAAYLGVEVTGTEKTFELPPTDVAPANAESAAAAPEAPALAVGEEPITPNDDAMVQIVNDQPVGETAETTTITRTVARDGLEDQYLFFARISPKGISWMVWLLVGIFLGSLVSALLSGGFRLSLMPHSDQWRAVFGSQVWKRWGLVFAGSILIAVAAGIAGGCTSGLAIAKGVQLAPAAFLFIMGMFITGPITAALVYRRRF
ncbi:MAG: YeeE/YedE family protein [Chloroflexi bacterium]|nr:YeeE/YedE family protein [Chloroflexota bacterium]